MYTYIPISPPSCISLPPSLSHPPKWSQNTELISVKFITFYTCLHSVAGKPCFCFKMGLGWGWGILFIEKEKEENNGGTSLAAQWLRIHLTMQVTKVQSLGREDPTCHGAAKPVHHNY